MSTESPYNANPELSVMKEDVATRKQNLTYKKMFIGGATIAAGIVIGAMLMPAFGTMALLGGIGLGVMAGGGIAELMTMKETTKLKIDEDMVQSYMSGKNHWGAGYRQEVAEYGYGGPQATPNVSGPNPQRPRGGGMNIG